MSSEKSKEHSQFSLLPLEEMAPLEPKTTVRLGRKSAQIPLQKKRRIAVKRLVEILKDLEGNDIFIGSYSAGGNHFWLDNLKLGKLQLEVIPASRLTDNQSHIPSVIVLWGHRNAHIRIFTDFLTAIREQEYQGYQLYLLDFHNGFWASPIDSYRSHYACLTIAKFKD